MSEFLNIAVQILKEVRQPMTPKGIWHAAEDKGLVPDKIAGKTPIQTLKSKLSVHIRTHGDVSPFVRTAPGRFFLREFLESRQPYYARALEPPSPNERVLAFRADLLETLGRFQGIKTSCSRLYRELLRPRNCTYLPRSMAEANNDYKQVITYIMITCKGRLLAFKRGNYTRTDKFLRGSHCVGFGGHVVDSDFTLFNEEDCGVRDSAIREIFEEIAVPATEQRSLAERIELVGALNDDSSEVGRRHFAFIFRYEVEAWDRWSEPRRGEKAVTNLRWLDSTQRSVLLRDFEYWSQLCLRTYFAEYVLAEPSYLVRRKKNFTRSNILCILGPVGSGKTEATHVFKEDYGYMEINTGMLLGDILNIPPVPKTPRAEFQRAAVKFIQSPRGPAQLAKAIALRAREAKGSQILVDGIRNRSTLAELGEIVGRNRLALIYVHTPPDIAFRFYEKRLGQPVSIQEFVAVRESPVESEVVGMIEDADAVLYNWTGKMGYRQTIRAMMRDLELA